MDFKELLRIQETYFKDLPHFFCYYLSLLTVDEINLKKLVSRHLFNQDSRFLDLLLCWPDPMSIRVRTLKNKLEDEKLLIYNCLFSDSLENLFKEHLTEEICELSLKLNGSLIRYISFLDFDEEAYFYLCKIALEQEGLAIKYIKRQDLKKDCEEKYFELCQIALENNAKSFEYIDQTVCGKMTQERMNTLCLSAVEKLIGNLSHVRNLTSDVYISVVKRKPDIIKQLDPENIYLRGLYPKPTRDLYIKLCKIMVEHDGSLIRYIPRGYITKELCYVSIEKNALNLQFIPWPPFGLLNITETDYLDICKLALRKDGDAIVHCQIRNYEIYEMAVRSNGLAL